MCYSIHTAIKNKKSNQKSLRKSKVSLKSRQKLLNKQMFLVILTVTMDELATGNINGVKIVHLADFLLSKDY